MTYWTIKLMAALGLATKVKLPKITHAAPIVSPAKAAKIARKAQKKVNAGNTNDGEAELVGAGR